MFERLPVLDIEGPSLANPREWKVRGYPAETGVPAEKKMQYGL